MGYEDLFTKRDLALVYDWLRANEELYVDLDRPHSGGLNNSVHFIESLGTLKEIVSRETSAEVCISIFREKLYPIRGIAGDRLLARALDQIPDGQWFSMIAMGEGPAAPCTVAGGGEGHGELREEFARLRGRNVRVGQNPFDRSDAEVFFEQPDAVWVARFYRHRQPPLSKNRITYPPYDADPDRYRAHIDFW